MLQSLNEVFGDLKVNVKDLPPVVRNLTTLAMLSFLGALAWVAYAKPGSGGAVALALPASLAFLALGLLVLASYYSVVQKVGQVDQKVDRLIVRARMRPAYHVGCRIGRRRLECGVLEVNKATIGLPDTVADVRPWTCSTDRDGELPDGALLRHSEHGLFQGTDLYRKLVAAIADLFTGAERNGLTIASIGIAVPGGIRPALGTFDGIVEGVPFGSNEDITGRVADLLLRRLGPQTVAQVFGTSDPQVMRAQIHLDNDARCAARWLLVEKPSWSNFVCVFVGSGLGSGLVFNREILYGNRFRAGEVGHVNLNLGSRLLLDDGEKGWQLQARQCSCGKLGYHFESLAGIGGLGHLARVLDGDTLGQIRSAYRADAERDKQLDVSSVDAADADGMMILRTLAGVTQPIPHIPERHDPIFVEHILPDDSFLRFVRQEQIRDYLTLVARHYARLFRTGIAALLDALDVDHIALCGTIPEYLQHNHEFVSALQRSLPDEIPGTQRGISLDYGSMLNWGWRGAALLPRDLGYLNRRF